RRRLSALGYISRNPLGRRTQPTRRRTLVDSLRLLQRPRHSAGIVLHVRSLLKQADVGTYMVSEPRSWPGLSFGPQLQLRKIPHLSAPASLALLDRMHTSSACASFSQYS